MTTFPFKGKLCTRRHYIKEIEFLREIKIIYRVELVSFYKNHEKLSTYNKRDNTFLFFNNDL